MLTTRCPHCSTVFRVRPEQLSMRGGRVRCGQCRQPFSALAHLEEFADAQPAETPAAVAATPVVASATPVEVPPAPVEAPAADAPVAAAPVPSFAAEAALPPESAAEPVPASVQEPFPPHTPEPAPVFETPAPFETPAFSARSDAAPDEWPQAIQLEGPSPAEVRAERTPEVEFDIDFARLEAGDAPAGPAAPTEAEDAGDGRIEPGVTVFAQPYESRIARELGIEPFDPEQVQAFGQTVMLEEPIEIASQPAFAAEAGLGPMSLADERDRQADAQLRVEDRRVRHTGRWIAAAVLLALLALVLAAYVFRTEIARAAPAARPLLEQACATLGCDVPYPRDAGAEQIRIESSEFFPEAGGNNRFRLVASIANRVHYAQAWPSLELTITDRFDIAIARRVFKPEEWLPADQRNLPAFPADGEVSANLAFDLGQLAASGYRLYVFYP